MCGLFDHHWCDPTPDHVHQRRHVIERGVSTATTLDALLPIRRSATGTLFPVGSVEGPVEADGILMAWTDLLRTLQRGRLPWPTT
jgi:hypothetical protein